MMWLAVGPSSSESFRIRTMLSCEQVKPLSDLIAQYALEATNCYAPSGYWGDRIICQRASLGIPFSCCTLEQLMYLPYTVWPRCPTVELSGAAMIDPNGCQ